MADFFSSPAERALEEANAGVERAKAVAPVAGVRPPTTAQIDDNLVNDFANAAVAHQVPADALMAIAERDSGFDQFSRSRGPGEKTRGIIKMSDRDVAENKGVNPYIPAQAIDVAARKMRGFLDSGMSVPDAIKATKFGPDKGRWGAEAEDYANGILSRSRHFADTYFPEPTPQPAPAPGQTKERPGILAQAAGDVVRGVKKLKGTGIGLAALAADATGFDSWADGLLKSYVANEKDIQENNAPVIGSYKNIHDLGDAGRYAVEALFENLPMMVGSMGTGAVGGVVARKVAQRAVADMVEKQVAEGIARSVAENNVANYVARRTVAGAAGGAYAASAGMESGSIMGDVYSETGQKRPGIAAGFGAVAGALDAIEPVMAISKVVGPAVKDAVVGSLVKRLGVEGAKQFATEAGTEGLQAIIEHAATTAADGRPLFTPELLDDVIDSALKGGLAGGVTGVASQGIGEAVNPPQPQAEPPRDPNAMDYTPPPPGSVSAAAMAENGPLMMSDPGSVSAEAMQRDFGPGAVAGRNTPPQMLEQPGSASAEAMRRDFGPGAESARVMARMTANQGPLSRILAERAPDAAAATDVVGKRVVVSDESGEHIGNVIGQDADGILIKDEDGGEQLVSHEEISSGQTRIAEAPSAPAQEAPKAEEAKLDLRKPAESTITDEAIAKAPTAPAPRAPERSLSEMSEVELRERLKFIASQAKAGKGWTKPLMVERRKVETEIEARSGVSAETPKVDEAAPPPVSDEKRAKAVEYAKRNWWGARSAAESFIENNGLGDTHEVKQDGRKFSAAPKAENGFVQFDKDSGTLGVPRAEMPQVAAEHHGALTNFLNARGIEHETKEVSADELKPTQAEFSPDKVENAKDRDGDRSVIVSNDGHVIDGHHQWLAAKDDGEPVKAIVLDAPAEQALEAVKEFPSATTSQESASANDVAKGKWFGTREKAEAFIEKKGLGGTHEIKQSGKFKFEIVPKSVATTTVEKSIQTTKSRITDAAEIGRAAFHKGEERNAPIAFTKLEKEAFLASYDREASMEADLQKVVEASKELLGKKIDLTPPTVTRLNDDAGRYTVSSGAQLYSTSGRALSAAPKADVSTPRKRTATLDRQNQWLVDEARKEAQARGDTWMGNTILKAMNPDNLSMSDHDTLNDYLFGDTNGPSGSNFKPSSPQSVPKVESAPEKSPEPAKPAEKSLGSSNTIFTKEAYEAARKRFTDRHKGQFNSGIDPADIIDGLTLAGFHIEAGARAFSSFAKAMVSDFGDNVRPYLKSWYLGVKFDPRSASLEGMTGAAEVEAADIDKILAKDDANEPSKLDQSGQKPLEGVPADAVQGTEADGGAGKRAEEGGRADEPRNERAGEPGLQGARSLGDGEGTVSVPAGGKTERSAGGERGREAVQQDRAGEEPAVEGRRGVADSASFKKWFSGSKVVDASGKPLRVYHGSIVWEKDGVTFGVFDQFDRMASVKLANRAAGMDTVGNWFSDNPEAASEYAGSAGTVYPVYLHIENPWKPKTFNEFRNKVFTERGDTPRPSGPSGSTDALRTWLKSNGYDGIQFPWNEADKFDHHVWVALEPEQIRSAIAYDKPSSGSTAQDRPSDFAITDEDRIGEGGQKTKFRQNVDAIRLLRQLEADGRPATRAEQATLAKWVGWGGLPQAFERSDGSTSKGWEKEVAELRDLLSPEELKAAAASTRNAHYTSPEIVKGMWSALRRLGFDRGRVLEPSVGVGNFFGLMPADMRSASALHGVELDPITGGIAKQLYPAAKIVAPMGFQNFTIPDGYFDAVIGNPPFGSEKLYDPNRKDLSSFSIHNYFFAKSLDGLRPGGVMAMVVTNRMMDARSDEARQYLRDRADLVAAIRLPNDAFAKNAGTEVTTDIVILRKREEGDAPAGEPWGRTLVHKDKNGVSVPLNEYFAAHPENMLGEFGDFGTMYAARARGDVEPALIAREGQDTSKLLAEAIERLPRDIVSGSDVQPVAENIPVKADLSHVRVGSMFVQGGKAFVREEDQLGEPRGKAVEFPNEKAEARVLGMLSVRDHFADLRRLQLDPTADDRRIEAARDRLNSVYDVFKGEHGYINSDANKRLFRDDPSWPQISALEEGYDKGVSASVAKTTGEKPRGPSASKAAVFSRRTQAPYSPPVTAKSAKDALVSSLSERGRVDLDYMSKLYDKTQDQVLKELGDLVFNDPIRGPVTREEYLSGNVKQKLAEARDKAKIDGDFERNVAALEQVQPKDIAAADISVKPGAHWVPREDMLAFVQHILGARNAGAFYNPASGRWTISGAASDDANVKWGTSRARVADIVEAAASQKAMVIRDKVDEKTTVVNEAETEAANAKVQAVKDEWDRWIFDDDDRRDRLSRIYNDMFNTNVQRSFDGSHLTFPGKIGDDIISLRPHQKNAIWRILQSGTTLLDHIVGAGKTFTIVGAVMEGRRMGLMKKPMLIVPNHLVEQWAADFIRLYPSANILAATKKDFEKENRKRLFARIATGDWDAVIVAHSSFGRVEVEPEAQIAFIEKQVADLVKTQEEVRSAEGKEGRNVKQIQEQIQKKTEKMKKLLDTGRKDDALYWGELGVDGLFVDEAHEFKNLEYSTSMQRVAGLGNQQGSQKASDLYLKVDQVLQATGGRNVSFATGTPISNTMAEMFTMQRYLDGKTLEQQGLSHFDAWARMYGEIVSSFEISPAGKYKLNSRFAKFTNLPELMQSYTSFADVIGMNDIRAQLAEQGKRLPVPRVKGGKPQNIVVDRSPHQADYIGQPIVKPGTNEESDDYPKGSLIWRADHLPKRPERGADNMLKVMSDARKAALDMRLIDPSYPDYAGSKVNEAAKRIKQIYDKWHGDKGTQLVFIDLSTPKNAQAKEARAIRELMEQAEAGDEAAQEKLDNMSPDEMLALDSKFSVYDDLKEKLIARGIPADEIAFIHDANTDQQKSDLFAKVRSGRIRVFFGSTAKMGAGTNVQNRLVALHHLDAPWRPSDLEQREGRIIRQGNELFARDPDNFEVEINRYATKQTLDSRMWQTIESKANFIEQIRKGTGERSVEDVAGEAMNSAEMKAAASGNPLVFDEMELRQKVRKLTNEEYAHKQDQYRVRDAIRYNEGSNKHDSKLLADMIADRTTERPDKFEVKIRGDVFEKRREAGERILDEAKALADAGGNIVKIGSYGGFGLSIARTSAPKSFVLVASAKGEYESSVFNIDADAQGVAQRVLNMLPNETAIEKTKSEIESRARMIENMKGQIGEWSKRAELDDTKAKWNDVISKLKQKKPTEPPKASIGAEPGNMTAADLRDHLVRGKDGPLIQRLLSSGRIVLHDTAEALPGGAPQNAQGMTTANGTIHLVASNLTPETARAVLLHEAFHAGAEALTGARGWKSLMDRVQTAVDNAVARGEADGFWADAIDQARASGGRLAEEAAAYAVENYERAPAGIKDVVDRLIGLAKAWAVRAFGRQFGSVTPAQLRALAVSALRSATDSPEPTTDGPGGGGAPVREFGLSSEAGEPVFAFHNHQPMKRHSDYAAAKAGDVKAAARLVGDIVPSANLEEAARRFGKDAIYTPVAAQEASGTNAIPALLASLYASYTGATVGRNIAQASKSYHTGAGAMERMIARPRFDGPVERGGRYVIVDDVSVMGATIAELANHIRANGGDVVGSVLLVNASRSGKFSPESARLRTVERRFGDEIRQELGVDPSALTGPEADYLVNFRDVDALRDRIATAKNERSLRLRSKGLRGEEGREEGSISRPIRYSIASPKNIAADAHGLFKKASAAASDFLTSVMVGAKGSTDQVGKFSALALVPTRPLFLELAKGLPSAKHYISTKQAMDQLRNTLAEESDALLQKWFNYARKNKEENTALMDLMHESTIAQADPSKEWSGQEDVTPADRDDMRRFRPGSERYEAALKKQNEDAARKAAWGELKTRYDAMSDAAKQLYNEVRDAYEKRADESEAEVIANVQKALDRTVRRAEQIHADDMQRIADDGLTGKERDAAVDAANLKLAKARTVSRRNRAARIKRMREQFETNRLKGPYFPLARFGNYFVTVRDGEGKVISFSRFESRGEQRKFVEEMEKTPGHRVEQGVATVKSEIERALDPKFVAEVDALLEGAGAPSDLRDKVWQKYLETLPDLSIRKNRIHRKNRLGFDTDALRAFANNMFHSGHQLARLRYGMELQEHIDQAGREVRDADDPIRAGAVYSEMVRAHDFAMNPQGEPWAYRLSSFTFLWTMAFNISSAIVNLDQTWTKGIPNLAYDADTNAGLRKAASENARALRDVLIGRGFIENASTLTDDERKAIRTGYDLGVIDKTQAHDLANVAESGIDYSPIRHNIMKAASAPMHHTERLNREITFMAAYRIAKSAGLSQEKAIAKAADLTWMSHFDNQSSSKPRIMRSDIGRAAFALKAFQANILFRLFRDMHQTLHGADAETRKAAIGRIASTMLLTAGAAGIRGAYFYSLVMMMAGAFLGGDDPDEELRKWVLEHTGDTMIGRAVGGMIMDGAPGYITGTALSERLGLADLWFRSNNRDMNADQMWASWLEQLGGAPLGLAHQVYQGGSEIMKGNIVRGVEKIAPAAARNVVKAGRYAVEGVQDKNGNPIVENVPIQDVIKQAIGLTPAEISEQYARNTFQTNTQNRIHAEKSAALRAAGRARLSGDQDAIAAAQKKVDAYNAEVPEARITPKSIMQEAKRFRNKHDRMEFGVDLDPKLENRIKEETAPSIYRR